MTASHGHDHDHGAAADPRSVRAYRLVRGDAGTRFSTDYRPGAV